MKKIIITFVSFLSIPIALFAENLNTFSATVKNISASGYVIIYAKSNPVDVFSVTTDDHSVFTTLHKFKDFQKQDLSVVCKPEGIATCQFESHESAENALSLKNLKTLAPSKKECKDYVQKLRNALEGKRSDEIVKLYFSKSPQGLNPDMEIEFPDGVRKKHSDLIKQKFKSAKDVKILSQIRYWRGKNFALISGTEGKIRLLVDGEEVGIPPIYISKQASKGEVIVL
ncbi:MAG: hypothetical protein K6B46_04670 [Opitutales bacterium]|nr:hypothetical protein [Opitutales bacterium]